MKVIHITDLPIINIKAFTKSLQIKISTHSCLLIKQKQRHNEKIEISITEAKSATIAKSKFHMNKAKCYY